jgi:copper chaperone CopZ
MYKTHINLVVFIFVGIALSACNQSNIKKEFPIENTDVSNFKLDMTSLSLENRFMTTIEFDTIKLFDTLMAEKKTLLFIFDPSKSCMSCVKEIIECIDNIYENQKEFNLDDIILVSKYNNPKYLTTFKNRYNIKFTCLNSESDPIDKSKMSNYSYLYDTYFLLIKNYIDFKFLSITEPLVPDVFLSDLKSFYNE